MRITGPGLLLIVMTAQPAVAQPVAVEPPAPTAAPAAALARAVDPPAPTVTLDASARTHAVAPSAPTTAPVPGLAVTGRSDAPAAPREPIGLGGELVLGWTHQHEGPTGRVVRLAYEVLPIFPSAGPVGVLVGVQPGLEYWRAGADDWGFSVPLALVVGIRALPVRTTLGFGFDAVLVDQVAGDTGVGFWAPFAMARTGIDLHGFQVGADARIGYRWQFGAEDHMRWQLGLYAGYTWEAMPIHPRARRPAGSAVSLTVARDAPP